MTALGGNLFLLSPGFWWLQAFLGLWPCLWLVLVTLVAQMVKSLPDPGTEPTSSALAGGFFFTEPPGKLLAYGHITPISVSMPHVPQVFAVCPKISLCLLLLRIHLTVFKAHQD